MNEITKFLFSCTIDGSVSMIAPYIAQCSIYIYIEKSRKSVWKKENNKKAFSDRTCHNKFFLSYFIYFFFFFIIIKIKQLADRKQARVEFHLDKKKFNENFFLIFKVSWIILDVYKFIFFVRKIENNYFFIL